MLRDRIEFESSILGNSIDLDLLGSYFELRNHGWIFFRDTCLREKFFELKPVTTDPHIRTREDIGWSDDHRIAIFLSEIECFRNVRELIPDWLLDADRVKQ